MSNASWHQEQISPSVDYSTDHPVGAIAIILNKCNQTISAFAYLRPGITLRFARRHGRALEAQRVE